jgi:nucleoid DNA-binding protein
MGKVTITEIAKILVDKNKLTPQDAKLFAGTMFDLIKKRLNSEGQVKIKGLGTFKMIRIEARESVSVRTGERVMIDSHAKISFTPDNTMKELVNKPFSQFETVMLNDGVEFEDLPAAESEEEQELEQGPVQEVGKEPEPTQEPVQEQVQEPVQERIAMVETPVEKEPQREVVSPAAEPIAQPLLETVEDEPEQETGSSWKKVLGYCLLTLLLMAASAYGGYWYGQHAKSGDFDQVDEVIAEPVFVDSIETVTADSVGYVEDVPVAEEPKTEPAVEEKKEPAQEEEPFWKKYEAMDARVRTGAYHIVGTDHEVVVKKGETLSRIARRELGEDMSCYVEVYNGLKANAELKEGQVIKIPKLKWKKKRTLNN